MKLRNLIFALFLVIGAVGFVSCTGDDGATGPAGPAGPAGPQGEPGDSGDATNFYNFLTAWGSKTGEIGCDDSILTGSGPFPGPAALAPITEPGATDGPVAARCAANGALETITSTTADPQVVVGGETIVVTGEVILVKTMRGEEEISVVDTPPGNFNQATRTTTTKNFVGGLVFADMDTSGAFDGGDERRILYSDCGVGTAPSDIRGDWRGIHINASSQVFKDGVGVVDDQNNAVTTEVNTWKVCVKLDAHPGVTKCYINVVGGADAGAMIAIYNEDGTTTTVKDKDALGTLDTTTGTLFAANDLAGVDEVCEIFDEGAPSDNN